ncbi:MAG: porin [Burkholderiaceae bacterium]|nr:porin [Burkholderiaceae bacterium]
MVKTLISVAVLTVAGAASAQSSVTLFGVADAVVQYGTGSKLNKTSIGSGSNEVSRVGFRGTEDLGGGLSASFWLEAGFNIDAGTGQATNTNNQISGNSGSGGLAFNRRSTVGLAGNWGEVRLGRELTPQFGNTGAFDPFGGVGAGISETYRAMAASGANAGPTAARASNAVSYLLPSTLGGFYGHLMHYRGEGSGNNDGNGNGIRLGYANGPLNVSIGTGTTEYANGDFTLTNAGASWAFGFAKVMGQISQDRVGASKSRGYQIGAQIPLGTGEIRVANSAYRTDTGTSIPETKKYALGYVHNLSKRTAFYTTAVHLRNSGGSKFALNGAETAANTKSNGYEFGIRHRF